MALQQLPSNLYTGNAVVVDAMPYVRYADTLKKQKAAKDEALNQYYSKLSEKINTAGVRSQDLDGEQGGILRDIEEWKKDWMGNKGNIMKGGASQQDSMSRYQKILNKIGQSKARAKMEIEMGKAKLEGKYDPDDDDLNIIDKIGKSIYDPTSYKEDGVTEYGWNDTSVAIPQFDPTKQHVFFNAAIGKNKPTYDEKNARVDNVTGDVFIPKRFSQETVKAISDNAGNIFEGSKEAKKHYKKLLLDDAFMAEANKAFNSVYGRDINSPKELAQADAIMRTADAVEEVKVTDPNYAQKLRKEMESIKDRNIRGRTKEKTTVDESAGYITDENFQKHGKAVPQEYVADIQRVYGFTPVGFIEEKDIDIRDLETIKGKSAISSGTSPMVIGDKKFYLVRDDGNWVGANGKIIDRKAVRDAWLNKPKLSTIKLGSKADRTEGGSLKQKPQVPKQKEQKFNNEADNL